MWTDKLSLRLRKQIPATPKTDEAIRSFPVLHQLSSQLDSKRRKGKGPTDSRLDRLPAGNYGSMHQA